MGDFIPIRPKNPEVVVHPTDQDQDAGSNVLPYADEIRAFQEHYNGPGLPDVDDTDERELSSLLRAHGLQSITESGSRYWDLHLLRHLITKDRFYAELQQASIPECMTFEELVAGYIRIFTILVLLEETRHLVDFKKEGVNDHALPLESATGTEMLYSPSMPENPLECVNKLRRPVKDGLLWRQNGVMVPFFSLGENGSCKEHRLRNTSILPWTRWGDKAGPTEHGAYGKIYLVEISPTSHGFHELLKEMGLPAEVFAIKTLLQGDKEGETEFRKELQHLNDFRTHNNKHLMLGLAAFQYRGEWSIIFPKAECDLSKYMDDHSPPGTWDGMQGAAEQLSGLMSALGDIHSPVRLYAVHPKQKEPIFGMHGDIKGDNILCFPSTEGLEMLFVLADFGLSATHREQSRSNIPNKDIPPVPGYRPPECDIEGGTCSRLFDVWTIGCLYLDFLTWLLGGRELLEAFRKFRTTLYIKGTKLDIFFEFKRVKGGQGYVIQVKPEVRKWIERLRDRDNCSQMVQDMLTIIETNMLVVLAQGYTRMPAAELRHKFKAIHDLSRKDEAYCIGKGKRPRAGPFHADAVEAKPNFKARDWLVGNEGRLGEYSGTASAALPLKDQENPDMYKPGLAIPVA